MAGAIDPAWIDAALSATGTATVRRRKLPAEQVVWLAIGMGMFRDRSIAEVVDHLDLVLPAATDRQVTSGAIVQARDRLGAAPLECLFEQLAEDWAPASAEEHRWRGLALYGVDGSTPGWRTRRRTKRLSVAPEAPAGGLDILNCGSLPCSSCGRICWPVSRSVLGPPANSHSLPRC